MVRAYSSTKFFAAHVEMEEIGDLEARLEEEKASEDSSLEDSEDMDRLSIGDTANPSHAPNGHYRTQKSPSLGKSSQARCFKFNPWVKLKVAVFFWRYLIVSIT